MIALAAAMLVGAFVLPDEARAGLIGGAAAVAASGAFLAYLDWPSKRDAPPGKERADAYVIDARLTGGEATGFQVVEMTLEVRPKRGVPFQVTRKFVGVSGRIEQGQKLSVFYDPADPQRIELA